MSTQTEVYEKIHSFLPTIHENKKSRGEVFTHIDIVDEQLSRLPDSVWKNKSFKWLDVASGVGNYSIWCYYKLMTHLSKEIPDGERRSKHIIEKMLFMVEIDSSNVRECRKLFKMIDPNTSPNIIKSDFLNTSVFHNQYFDVIIGNPPYTKPNKKNKLKLSTRSIYPDVIAKSLEILENGGYLSFIHPVSWRRYSRESRFSFDKYDILFMYTNNKFAGFGVSAPYINYYVLRKTYTPKLKTKYITVFDGKRYEGNSLHLKQLPLPFLPLLLNTTTIRILHKLTQYNSPKSSMSLNIKIISSNSTTKKSINNKKTSEFPHKNIHNYSIHKNKYVYRYSRKKHPSHNLQKIIMIYKGGYPYFKPIYNNKTLGITDNSMFMEVNDKTKDIVIEFLQSDIVKFVLKVCNYNFGRNMKNEYKILNLLNLPLDFNSKNLHKFYKLTKKDMTFIHSIIN